MFIKVFLVFCLLLIARLLSLSDNFQNGQILNIKAFVTSDPKQGNKTQTITISGISIILPNDPKVYYGDKIEIEGEYNDHKIEKAKLINRESTKLLFPDIKKKLVEFFQSSLPEPYSSLSSGIVFGAKNELPKSLKDSLIKTATSHVVVASGMNVVIISGFFLSIYLKFMRRYKAYVLASICMWIYVVTIGFEAPLIRAAIMVSLANLAVLLGKKYSVVRSLACAFFFLLLINPFWFVDIGFWLSIFSTLSLIVFATKIDSKLSFVPGILREGISTSIAAQIGTAPFIIVVFGRLSMWGPIINALVLWTITPISILGSVASFVGLVFPFLGRIILYLSFPLLWWFVRVVTLV